MKLFIDTWGWVNIHNGNEPHHQEVKNLYQDFRKKRGILYTTDYILDETFTLLFKRLSFQHARESMEMLDQAVQKGYLRLEWIIPERFEEAKQLRLKYQDKPQISFTDLTSMVVMEELDITNVLTADSHFA